MSLKVYVFRCADHGDFESANQHEAKCPHCKKPGVRRYVSTTAYHPTKGKR